MNKVPANSRLRGFAMSQQGDDLVLSVSLSELGVNSILDTARMVAFALNAASNQREPDFQIPGTILAHRLPARDSLSNFRGRFEAWIISAGLERYIQILGQFLDSAVYVSQSRSSTQTGTNPRTFGAISRTSLPYKIEAVEQLLGIELNAEAKRSVLSINRARACLVHRGGVVTSRDIGAENGLETRWRAARLYFESPSGKKAIEGSTFYAPERGRVSLTFEPKVKQFPLGSEISFSAGELADMAWTFATFVEPVIKHFHPDWPGTLSSVSLQPLFGESHSAADQPQ